jgi:hypothetical protein
VWATRRQQWRWTEAEKQAGSWGCSSVGQSASAVTDRSCSLDASMPVVSQEACYRWGLFVVESRIRQPASQCISAPQQWPSAIHLSVHKADTVSSCHTPPAHQDTSQPDCVDTHTHTHTHIHLLYPRPCSRLPPLHVDAAHAQAQAYGAAAATKEHSTDRHAHIRSQAAAAQAEPANHSCMLPRSRAALRHKTTHTDTS